MLRYVANRLAASLVLLFAAASASFVIFHLLPGDPAIVIAGVNAPSRSDCSYPGRIPPQRSLF